MGVQIFYMKVEKKVEVTQRRVCLKDIAIVLARDNRVQNQLEKLEIHVFGQSTGGETGKGESGKGKDKKQQKSGGQKRVVLNITYLIRLIQEQYPECMVVSLGETDVVIEHRTPVAQGRAAILENIKILIIAVLCFFGTAFTIMAFHNDISIEEIFAQVYELLTGEVSDGFTILEISYSIGLALGIIVFFNHIGGRRISKDPTPIEVQMREYEADVVTTLVENADRNGEEID